MLGFRIRVWVGVVSDRVRAVRVSVWVVRVRIGVRVRVGVRFMVSVSVSVRVRVRVRVRVYDEGLGFVLVRVRARFRIARVTVRIVRVRFKLTKKMEGGYKIYISRFVCLFVLPQIIRQNHFDKKTAVSHLVSFFFFFPSTRP